MKKNSILCMCESAAMIALSFVLSLISVFKLPFGGSITACSMLPIFIISYRRGVKWGITTSLTFSLLQFVIGMENLQFATSSFAAAAIVIFDYVLAFGVLGFAGIFRDRFRSKSLEICLGGLLVCSLRYICHVFTGCTVWAGVSIPSVDGIWYSLIYNASYMLPETIITIIATWYVFSYVDITGHSINMSQKCKNYKHIILHTVSSLIIAISMMIDTVYLFSKIEKSDGFDITGIRDINPYLFFGLLIISVFVAVIIEIFIIKKDQS